MQRTHEEQAMLLQPLEAHREQLLRDIENMDVAILQTIEQIRVIENCLAAATAAERHAA